MNDGETQVSHFKSEQMLQGMKYLHLSPLSLHVRGLRNTRQPFVALVELWGSHRLPSAYRTEHRQNLYHSGPAAALRQSKADCSTRGAINVLVLTFGCRWWRHPLWLIVFLHRLTHQRQRGFRLLLPM